MNPLHPTRKMWRQLAATTLIAVLGLSHSEAAVRYFTPDSKEMVLQTVPLWQRSHAINPIIQGRSDPTQVAAQVRKLLQTAHRESDPRANGQARALLQPWWNERAAPSDILLVRAQLQQRQHHFDQASVDLNTLLQRQPDNSEARITLATIQTLRGDYSSAAKTCDALSRSRALQPALLCRANLMAVNGAAEKALQLYQALLQTSDKDQQQQQWLHTAIAETALRMGQIKMADNHYQQAIAIPLRDPYLLRSYADHLLAQNLDREVIRLLEKESRDDALLLRLAIANKALQKPQATVLQLELENRFNNIRLRGDLPHQDEQALYEWRLNNNPELALELMQNHWDTQKAPQDTYLFAQIASILDDDKSLNLLRDWQQQSQLQDQRLQTLNIQLASQP